MFFEAYKQLQCWPSPNFWEGHKVGIRTLAETIDDFILLTVFTNFTPLDRSTSDDLGSSTTSLTFWNNGGSVGDRTLTDTTTDQVTLTSFVHFLPIDNSVTDTTTGDVALTFMFVNTASGDRTLQDDTTSGTTLTKWIQ